MESPKLFGRWGTTRSYGPYGKSYASSSCDSDFESSTESDIPDEYWPYSDEEYSESVITDSDQMNFEDFNSIDSFETGSNNTMIGNEENLIDHEFKENRKIQVKTFNIANEPYHIEPYHMGDIIWTILNRPFGFFICKNRARIAKCN